MPNTTGSQVASDPPAIKLDREFQALIASLQPNEREQLEANIVANGCRDPLVLWNGILLDGHNRYEICKRLDIKYRTVTIQLSSRAHALLWIEENQLGRRNLTDDQRTAIAHSVLKRRAALSMSERGKQGGRGNKNLGENASPKFSERSRPAVAKEARVSEWKLRQFQHIEKEMPEAIPAIRAGEKTILEVKRELNEQAREEKREENRLLVEAAAPSVLVPGTFSTIVIDPPWDWDDEGDADQFGCARPTYNTMSIEEIAAQPIGEMAASNAHLYLWITNRSLPKGFALLEQWGFRYVTMLTWCKPSIGLGNYFRGSTEHVLFGVRGSLPLLAKDQPTHFFAPRRGHSVKPPEFYDIVERCSKGPWLDVFGRQQRKGWTVIGADVGVAVTSQERARL
jgi:N6-adenosine-specific RNA methylase IME4